MKHSLRLLIAPMILAGVLLACQVLSPVSLAPIARPAETLPSQPSPTPKSKSTPSSAVPVKVEAAKSATGNSNAQQADEPALLEGKIPYTSPFFLSTTSEPFVLLEDEAGFVKRDPNFEFTLKGQTIGPVTINQDKSITYSLSLPEIPQGTFVDVDNNGKSNKDVQIFAISYWSNTWGGPFLEKRDGTGWSSAYASTITDPDLNDEITGGTLLIWSPDDQQSFPTGFGPDGKLFTADDPIAPIPAGYSLVDLNQKPFRIYKESNPKIDLNEGDVAVNDYSKMTYAEAFKAMFDKASREYPFTKEKNIDWKALYDKFAPLVAEAKSKEDFYHAVREFTWSIPDSHVGLSMDGDVFYQERGGGFGLVLKELSDGHIIAAQVLQGYSAERAGIKNGAEILTWNDQPVDQAISQVVPDFGPFSTEQAKHLEQVAFLSHISPDTTVKVSFQNPGESGFKNVTMQAEPEYDSLIAAIPTLNQDTTALPVEGQILGGSGMGYIRINSFSDDYNLTAHLWDHFMKSFIDNKAPGIIIDVRANNGGSGQMALDFAGYFFNKEIILTNEFYYSERTGKFEESDIPSKIIPAPEQFDGPVAILISPYCMSACEGFSYAMTQNQRAIAVGQYPTAGAYGEVGRGQYDLPEGFTLQIPTGRPETADGKLVIEGAGIAPDIKVPVTMDDAMGNEDAILNAAEKALWEKVGQ